MRFVHFDTSSGSPDSEAWHTWRRNGIGGSDAATIAFNAGLLSREDAASWQRDYAGLLAEKRGERVNDKSSYAMRRGQQLEPMVRAWYEQVTGIPVSPCFGENTDFPFIRSSFDGAELTLDVLTEVKVANREVHEAAKANIVIPYYRPQIAHQALTAWGHPETWAPYREVHFVNHWEGETVMAIVKASDDNFRRLAEALLPLHKAFWQEVQDGRVFPEDVVGAAIEYKRLKAELDALTESLKGKEEALKTYAQSIGVPRLEIEGVRASESSRAGTVDYTALLASLGITPTEEQINAFRKAGSTSWTISVVGGKSRGRGKSKQDEAA